MKQNQKGFTLIELLVVVAIIGLLASVVVVTLNNARAKSRDAKRLADIRQLQAALELYNGDNGIYPAAGTTTTAGQAIGTGTGNTNFSTYTASWPAAPTPADTTTCSAAHGTVTTRTMNDYVYAQVNSGGSYTLDFCLGNATGSYPAGKLRATPVGIATY